MFNERLAIGQIDGIISKWDTMKIKLENAIEILKEVIKTNNQKKKDIEKKAKFETEKLDEKNNLLEKKIKEAATFKSNVEKMFTTNIEKN